VTIDFAHADGDLDLVLYDMYGTELVASTTASDDESVNFAAEYPDYFYFRVYGYEGAENVYDMTMTTY
jgi:hypothetical protein